MILINAIIIIVYFIDLTKGQSCVSFDVGQSIECAASSACQWIGDSVNGKCRCASPVALDILFGVDTSGSIGNQCLPMYKKKLITPIKVFQRQNKLNCKLALS